MPPEKVTDIVNGCACIEWKNGGIWKTNAVFPSTTTIDWPKYQKSQGTAKSKENSSVAWKAKTNDNFFHRKL